MQLRTNALVEAFPDLRKELGEKALATISPALIGMSLRQDIPGGLPSGRARFRFSCQDHSGTEHPCYQQKRSERQSVPTCRVSKLDALYRNVLLPMCPVRTKKNWRRGRDSNP